MFIYTWNVTNHNSISGHACVCDWRFQQGYIAYRRNTEDILHTEQIQCCTMFRNKGFKQMVMKPTHDSGPLIDHICRNQKLQIQTDVSDCYYSDHDYVLCIISKDTISTWKYVQLKWNKVV